MKYPPYTEEAARKGKVRDRMRRGRMVRRSESQRMPIKSALQNKSRVRMMLKVRLYLRQTPKAFWAPAPFPVPSSSATKRVAANLTPATAMVTARKTPT